MQEIGGALVAVSIVLLMLLAVFRYPFPRLDLASPVFSGKTPASQSVQLTNKGDFIASNLISNSDGPEFELPTAYGIYALSQGKLIELKPLPIMVPDQRIAISAMISNPSLTNIPTGKISFLLYRRDLSMSAPDRASIRVVARVARQLKFIENKPAVTIAVDGQWAIRSNSYEFRVAPLRDHNEMIVVRAADAEFSLPAGRYALVLDRMGYDFTVAGRITETAQCLERSDTIGGIIYAECRQPFSR
jgi:hypothetical protein